ncbi:MAG: hypothetical protein ACOZQL_06140 [Myxococcota bacterium]
MRRLLPLLLVAHAALAAEPMTLLIFAGGATEADAQAALESFKKLEDQFVRAVQLPSGEPRVVASDSLPGLKPGFHVVTLGLCRDAAPALAALKAIYPGTYTRPLTGDAGPERCPTVQAGTVTTAHDRTVKVADAVLSAFTFVENTQDERGHEVGSATMGFALIDKVTGRVLDVVTVEGGSTDRSGDGPAGWEYQSCTVAATPERTGFAVVRTCTDQRTGCSLGERSIPKAWKETQRVTIVDRRLSVSPTKRSVSQRTPCVAGASEGD